MNENICKMVTEQILTQLDAGVVPWFRPWVVTGGAVSHSTGASYSALNQMILGGSGEWATFKQIQEEGGQVRKGAKSKPVVFWKLLGGGVKENDGDVSEAELEFDRPIPFLRYYRVFKLEEDAEGVKPKYDNKKVMPNVACTDEAAEKIARDYLEREGINLVDGEIRDDAFYRVRTDEIRIPHISQFYSTAEYYSALFHEITHSTGAEKRLDRKMTHDRTLQKRVQEELVAEIGAAMLCSYAGITTEESLKNSASYIQGWRDKIAADNTLIVVAAGRAQKAVEYVLGAPIQKESA